MRIRAAFIACCVLFLVCNCEKRRRQERLTFLQQQHGTIAQRINERRERMRDAEHRLDTLNADLAAYNTDVHNYLFSHRVTAECIRASRSTWADNNVFSRDVSQLTKFGAAICTVALLNAEFAQEVTQVTGKLAEADAHVKSLQREIAAARRAVDAERSEVERNEAELDPIAAEISDLQRKLQ